MASIILTQENHQKRLDSGADSKTLLPIDIAIERGLRLAKSVKKTKILPLKKSLNRILAQDIIAPFPQPAFNNSAMDGYAISFNDLKGDAPWTLKVSDKINAGDNIKNLAKSAAIQIFTGAPVPQFIDAIIMHEHIKIQGDEIIISSKPAKGENIRLKGENILASDVLVEKGQILTPARIALAASCGLAKLEVLRKVKIAIFSIGSELAQPEEFLQSSKIYNSNRYLLQALLNQPYIKLIDLGAVPDDAEKLAFALKKAATLADIIISSGGIMIGSQDELQRLDKKLSSNLSILKLAMKPGKPIIVGEMQGSVYIGLPGNPMAAQITFNMIAKPIIKKRAGLAKNKEYSIFANSSFERKRRPFRNEYLPVKIVGNSQDGALMQDGALIIEMLGNGGSAEMLPIAQADGMVLIAAGKGSVQIGDKLEFLPL
jgi:molybdopterin molybdotransferase